MASCFIDAGYSLDCRNASTGGIKEIWILGDSGSTVSGVTYSASDDVLSMSGVGTWYNFELVKQSSSITEEMLVNTTAQSIVFQPTVTISLPKLDQALRNTFFDLAKQNSIYLIALDNNSRYWLVGIANGLLMNTGSLQSGLAYNDLNGTTFTLQGGEPNPIVEITVSTTLQDVMTGMTVEA